MKKLLLLSALCAIAANLNGAAIASKPWQDPTGKSAYTGPTFNPQVAGALGALYRAFTHKTTGPLAAGTDGVVNQPFYDAVVAAAETGDFRALDNLGKTYAILKADGVKFPQWIELAKTGHIPAVANPSIEY